MFSSLSHYSLHFVLLAVNTITKHALRHPYQTRSKTRIMAEIEEVQEQMKADMDALKDQMASMMEAMLSMKRMMESNATAVAATSAAVEADPTHPSTINQANQSIPDMVDQGEVLGSTDGPHVGHNRNTYLYDLPPNYTPPNAVPMPNKNANRVVPVLFEGQQPQPMGENREDPRDHAQVDFEPYTMFATKGPACSGMSQPNTVGAPQHRPL